MIKVLSTKQLSEQLLSIASQKGVSVDCIPFIQIHYSDQQTIEAMLKGMEEDAVFIFTSQHAVRVALPVIKDYRNDTYCIAGATADALKNTALQIRATAESGAALVKKIPVDPSRQYFFFCGNQRMDTIPSLLTANGLSCTEVLCYENTPTPVIIDADYDGVMFFSPSGVKSYFSCNEPKPGQIFYCIGTTTGKAVKGRVTNEVKISETPTVESMIALINK